MIYVDNYGVTAKVKNIKSKWYHLVSIPKNNKKLIEFAEKIGLKKEWIQKADSLECHFDVTESKRKLAIENGAKPITALELGSKLWDEMMKIKNKGGQ